MLNDARGRKTRDDRTVKGFGEEWARFDQIDIDEDEHRRIFDGYFADFPWKSIAGASRGIDVGAGTGRWARLMAERVGCLLCVEPSVRAVDAARRNLATSTSCVVVRGAAGELPIAPASLDFGYIIGVLHHTPDPLFALRDAAATLKPGAPMLIYVYYAFDNRPRWFRVIWRLSDLVRRFLTRRSAPIRFVVAEIIATTVYLPLAALTRVMDERGYNVDRVPLSSYRDKSFYTMRTDALDRFGTSIETRFTAARLIAMMESAGLKDITVAEGPPYWRALGYRQTEY